MIGFFSGPAVQQDSGPQRSGGPATSRSPARRRAESGRASIHRRRARRLGGRRARAPLAAPSRPARAPRRGSAPARDRSGCGSAFRGSFWRWCAVRAGSRGLADPSIDLAVAKCSPSSSRSTTSPGRGSRSRRCWSWSAGCAPCATRRARRCTCPGSARAADRVRARARVDPLPDPVAGYMPDFMTPPPTTPLATFEEELELVRSTPPRRIRRRAGDLRAALRTSAGDRAGAAPIRAARSGAVQAARGLLAAAVEPALAADPLAARGGPSPPVAPAHRGRSGPALRGPPSGGQLGGRPARDRDGVRPTRRAARSGPAAVAVGDGALAAVAVRRPAVATDADLSVARVGPALGAGHAGRAPRRWRS